MAELDMDRVTKRELTSSRAVAAVVVAVVVILLSLYALLECGLRIMNQPAWLLDPQQAWGLASHLPAGVSVMILGIVGAVMLLIGLIFLIQALAPGRRARHVIPNERMSVVVDDEVVASALARRVRAVAAVTPEQVMVVVSQRQVVVTIRPTSRTPLNADAITTQIQAEADAMDIQPTPQVRVNISSQGAVGV